MSIMQLIALAKALQPLVPDLLAVLKAIKDVFGSFKNDAPLVGGVADAEGELAACGISPTDAADLLS